MSDDLAFTAFLGDANYRFLITPALIPELESTCGIGIGTIFQRVGKSHFHYADVTNTIRLGLIGGGMKPVEAARLCSSYVEHRPLIETVAIALSILERLWFGAELVDALVKEIKGADDAAT